MNADLGRFGACGSPFALLLFGRSVESLALCLPMLFLIFVLISSKCNLQSNWSLNSTVK